MASSIIIFFISTLILSIHGLPTDIQNVLPESNANVVPGVFISVDTLKNLQAQAEQNGNNPEVTNDPNAAKNQDNKDTLNTEQGMSPVVNPNLASIQQPALTSDQGSLTPNSQQVQPNQQDLIRQQQMSNQQPMLLNQQSMPQNQQPMQQYQQNMIPNQEMSMNPQQQFVQQPLLSQQVLPNQYLVNQQQTVPAQQYLVNQQQPFLINQQPLLTNQQQYVSNVQPNPQLYVSNQQQQLQQPYLINQQPYLTNQQPIYVNQQQMPNQSNLQLQNGLQQPGYIQQNQQIPLNQGQSTLLALNPINNGQIMAAEPFNTAPISQNQGATLYAVVPVNNGQNAMSAQNGGSTSILVPYQQIPSNTNQVYALNSGK